MTPIAIHVGSSVTAKTTIPVVSPTPIHCPVLPALKEFFDLLSTFTLQFYFVILINSSNLKLLKVDDLKLDHLLWEQASDGNMFPHLYSALDLSNVIEEFELTLGEDGLHILPANF